MRREQAGALLSTVFVDYDNIYLSLKRKSEEAAKRFAKDAPLWLGQLLNGRLITPTNGAAIDVQRRIVMNRCYGNPVPRRNSSDNSTDMNSFPFVRHHFLRAGFEVVDCPPLTAQLKNSSDIRMVMDVRDYLTHDTYFDEFIILSGDADFTPLLHRLRAHARRTVIFANDYTATPYTAISDGEVREADLIALLLEGRAAPEAEGNAPPAIAHQPTAPGNADLEASRRDIIREVVTSVRSAGQPVPLEALADRAVRTLGHDRTVGTAWGGTGSFRDLLMKALPEDIRLNEQPPYFVFDAGRQIAQQTERQAFAEEPAAAPSPQQRQPQMPEPRSAELRADARLEPTANARAEMREPRMPLDQRAEPRLEARLEARLEQPSVVARPIPERAVPAAEYAPLPQQHAQQHAHQHAHQHARTAERAAEAAPTQRALPAQHQRPVTPQQQPAATAPQAPARAQADSGATAIQRSIARIHEACQAPPLSPPEYRALFDVLSQEINQNGLNGAQTLVNIAQRAGELGIETRRDDIRFVLDVVSESDPWFDQGASPKLFAGRFRNFVVARCRSQGLTLSADELDLIDAWFAGTAAPQSRAPVRAPQPQQVQAAFAQAPAAAQAAEPTATATGERWWNAQAPAPQAERFGAGDDVGGDEFPRIVRRGVR